MIRSHQQTINCMRRGVFVALVSISASTAFAEDSIERVAERIRDLGERVRTLEADVSLEASTAGVRQEAKGTFAMRRDDERVRTRQELTLHMRIEDLIDAETRILTVTDGATAFVETRSDLTGVQVVKLKTDALGGIEPTGAMLDGLIDKYELSLGKETRVDGQRCWTIVAKVRQQPTEANKPAQIELLVRQKDGIPARIDAYNNANAKLLALEYSKIRVNRPLDAKQFDYTPPEGATVIDLGDAAGGLGALGGLGGMLGIGTGL